MKEIDIRWEQRFENYQRALARLGEGVAAHESAKNNQKQLSTLEKEGVIQRFEFTWELAWNVMKDFVESQFPAKMPIIGSKDAIRHFRSA